MADPQQKTQIHRFPSSAAAEGAQGPRVANWAIIGIFVILVFGAVAFARDFLMPVCLGTLLFFVFVPFRRWMDRRNVPAGATAGIVTLGMVLTVVVLGYFISGPAGQLITDAPEISKQLKEKYDNFRESFRGIERAAEGLGALTGSDVATNVVMAPAVNPGAAPPTTAPVATTTTTSAPAGQGQPATTQITTTTPAVIGGDAAAAGASAPARPAEGIVTAQSTVTQPGGPASNRLTVEVRNGDGAAGGVTSTLMSLGPAIVTQTIFTLLFLFFLLASGDLLYLRIVQSFDTLKEKRAAYQALREIEDSLGNYLGAISIINVGLGVCTGLAMWAWGMPSPLLWGIAGAVLNFIPYIGAAIGYVGSALVALVVFNDAWTALLVGGTYFALTAIEGQFVTPIFVSKRLQLNTVVVFLTVALWAWLWSVLGMVVAVPVLVVIRVLADHIPGLEKFGNFLAGEAPPGLDDEEEDEEPKAEAGSAASAAAPVSGPPS